MAKLQLAKTGKLGFMSNVLSVGQWTWDKAAIFLASTAGGAVMALLGSLTSWVSAWGPIAWGGIGLLTFTVLALTLTAAGAFRSKSALNRAQTLIAEKVSDTALINPLERRFLSKRISLHDLRTVAGEPLTDRIFDQCELVGPAVIVLIGGTMSHCGMTNVECGKIKEDKVIGLPNKLIFQNCQVLNCKIYNVIFLVLESQADNFEQGTGGSIDWITP